MKSVETVATARPPRTALPSGPEAVPPNAMGTMPAIIAKLVIKIGRTRPAKPSSAACFLSAPARCARSANVTNKIAFETDTPTAMTAPMKLCKFSVSRVIHKAPTTPASTAGTALSTTIGKRTL